jgi:hypothetical protein
MPEDSIKKHLKIMSFGFGIAFVALGLAIGIVFGFFDEDLLF